MAQDNINQSLDATQQALSHMADQLEQAGFAAGAPAYTRMAEVIISQALQMKAEGNHDVDEQFHAIKHLAERIHAQLHPYASAMEKLLAIGELIPEKDETRDPDSLGGKIVTIISSAPKPQSFTAIRTGVGAGTRAVRAELDQLVETGVVKRGGNKNRPVYELAS